MKVCIDKGTDSGCCKAWAKGIRTINNQYPDDNREFGIIEGTGISITPETAGIRITCTVPAASTLTAGDNIDISPGGNDEIVVSLVSDPIINGDIQVNGDIIQNGSAYETHAEKIFTTNDYIVTRDGAISALSAGDYSGFQVKKYDGTNDGRLVIDNTGTARVGDVGDEQPLLTRDESADLTNGHLIEWDATGFKAIDAGTDISTINNAINGKVSGTGNIGSDTKPIKIVNGAAVAVTDNLAKASDISTSYTIPASNIEVYRFGKVCTISLAGVSLAQGQEITILNAGTLPTHTGGNIHVPIIDLNGQYKGVLFVNSNGRLAANTIGAVTIYTSLTYTTV